MMGKKSEIPGESMSWPEWSTIDGNEEKMLVTLRQKATISTAYDEIFQDLKLPGLSDTYMHLWTVSDSRHWFK